jgi:hypothetical protein
MFGFRDDDGDNVQDSGDMHIDVVNVEQTDDTRQGIEQSFASLRKAKYVFNSGNMYFWNGFKTLRNRNDWRDMTAAQKREYWLKLRQNWNFEWDIAHRRFYSTTVRF